MAFLLQSCWFWLEQKWILVFEFLEFEAQILSFTSLIALFSLFVYVFAVLALQSESRIGMLEPSCLHMNIRQHVNRQCTKSQRSSQGNGTIYSALLGEEVM